MALRGMGGSRPARNIEEVAVQIGMKPKTSAPSSGKAESRAAKMKFMDKNKQRTEKLQAMDKNRAVSRGLYGK